MACSYRYIQLPIIKKRKQGEDWSWLYMPISTHMNSLKTVAFAFVLALSNPCFLWSNLRSSVKISFLTASISLLILKVSCPDYAAILIRISSSLSFDFCSLRVKSWLLSFASKIAFFSASSAFAFSTGSRLLLSVLFLFLPTGVSYAAKFLFGMD